MVVTVENVDRIRFRSFLNPLYRDTTVSRYLSDKMEQNNGAKQRLCASVLKNIG